MKKILITDGFRYVSLILVCRLAKKYKRKFIY